MRMMRTNSMLASCVLVALLGCSSVSAALRVPSPRLRETALDFTQQDRDIRQASSGPERVAGYFRLSRRCGTISVMTNDRPIVDQS